MSSVQLGPPGLAPNSSNRASGGWAAARIQAQGCPGWEAGGRRRSPFPHSRCPARLLAAGHVTHPWATPWDSRALPGLPTPAWSVAASGGCLWPRRGLAALLSSNLASSAGMWLTAFPSDAAGERRLAGAACRCMEGPAKVPGGRSVAWVVPAGGPAVITGPLTPAA